MSKFLEDAERDFNGCDLETLKQHAQLVGVDIKGNMGEETLRLRLRAAIGKIAQPSRAVSKTTEVLPRPTEKPNLTTIGTWGGRCRDVSIYRPPGDVGPGCPLGWDAMRIYVPFGSGEVDSEGKGTPYTIPEPHFHSLKNAMLRSFKLDCQITKMGVDRKEENLEEQAYPFQDHGVTPGTEHLPGSSLEWFQWEAERKDYFKLFKKSRLEEIYSELTDKRPGDSIPGVGWREWDREKCRTEILKFLGPAYFKQADQDEEDPALLKEIAA